MIVETARRPLQFVVIGETLARPPGLLSLFFLFFFCFYVFKFFLWFIVKSHPLTHMYLSEEVVRKTYL